jgi:hypothetical protein
MRKRTSPAIVEQAIFSVPFKPLENEVMETYCPKDLNLNKNEANGGIKDNLRDP